MTFANAIIDGFRKSFTSRGRMARGDYWMFFPVALVLPIAFATQVDWLEIHVWKGMAKLAGLFVCSIPLMNATARRLTDAGFDKEQASMPFAPLAILWVGYQCILWGGLVLGPLGGVLVLVFWLVAFLILIPLHVVALLFTLMITATVIGQTLVASQLGSEASASNSSEAYL